MHTRRRLFPTACLLALTASALSLHAQQASQVPSGEQPFKTPLAGFASASAGEYFSSSSSGSSSAGDSLDRLRLDALALNSFQPPPRRPYGRPRYSDSHTNPDGSSKLAFMVGGGATLPVGNTHKYETPSYGFQAGVGRNFSQSAAIMLQFDYDHFGLQGSTLANQNFLYGTTGFGLNGNNHVWSFTIDPTFSLVGNGSMGAYAVVGFGFYHKVTNFTLPTTGTYCNFFACYNYQANQIIDHYTSNAPGVNGGLGLTFKLSRFSNQRLYIEGRYVVVFNEQRIGITAANANTPFGRSYTGYNLYPANSNRTTYVPIKVGIRF